MINFTLQGIPELHLYVNKLCFSFTYSNMIDIAISSQSFKQWGILFQEVKVWILLSSPYSLRLLFWFPFHCTKIF